MLNRLASLAMSTSAHKALPGKLEIKRREPGILYFWWICLINVFMREYSGSVVECLTWDRRAAGLSLTGVTALWTWARHIYPSLVLVQPRKTSPYINERLLMGRKESNKTSNSYTLGCPPVCGDNPRALASGLSYVQVDKHGITNLYHLPQCRPCTSRDISC